MVKHGPAVALNWTQVCVFQDYCNRWFWKSNQNKQLVISLRCVKCLFTSGGIRSRILQGSVRLTDQDVRSQHIAETPAATSYTEASSAQESKPLFPGVQYETLVSDIIPMK